MIDSQQLEEELMTPLNPVIQIELLPDRSARALCRNFAKPMQLTHIHLTDNGTMVIICEPTPVAPSIIKPNGRG